MKFPIVRRLLRTPAPGRLWLAIQQKQQAPSFWEVAQDAVREIEQLPDGAWPILSISEDDLRVATAKPVSGKRAKSLIRQQCGQPARVINQSAHGAIYGRPLIAMTDGFAAVPAALLVDQLLVERGWPDAPFIAGFLLSAGESHNEILALWAGTPRGELGGIQFTENAQQAEQIVDAFCATHAIDANESNVLLFQVEELLAAVERFADRLEPYPDYDDWYGMPVQRLWSGIAGASALSAIGTVAALGVLFVQGQMMQTERERAAARASQSRQTTVNAFVGHLPTVVERSSVDHRALAANARAIYVPGGWVMLQANAEAHRLRLTLQIEPPQTHQIDVLTVNTMPGSSFEAARSRKVSGRLPQVGLSGGGNEIHFDYALQAANARLLGYLDR